MAHRVTIVQVAKHAGVSAMTVSNVLNGRPGASESTRERVLTSARELGYVPNAAARQLKSGRAGLVGISLADLRSAHSIELVSGITEELAVPGLEALISVAPQDGRRVELFAHGLTDGLILIAPALTDEVIAMLRDSKQPVVVVDPVRAECPFPHVVADDYGGMRMLTGAVLAAGHTDILYLQGEAAESASYADRRSGFAEALALADPPDAVVAVRGSQSTYEAGLADTADYLDERVPTAIVAASDAQAFGAMDAVRSAGLRVPADVSVVGFGDMPQAARSFPGLTTVHRPLLEMGRLAARTLVAQLEGIQPVQNRIELHTTYVERGTLGVVNRVVHPPKDLSE